ncbi:MAG: LysE family transporter [Bacteroidales bacterium]|jgi:threonine/homoserine/homoserine lactone efflux protein|nr:LysE family transporter [Bacteroidales bacterium]
MVAETLLIVKGMAAGFIISMPVGPVALLAITRTLHKGRLSGFFSGMGGATADTFYALVAAFGLTIVINFVLSYKLALQIASGLLVILFGLRIFTTNPVKDYRNRGREQPSLLKDYLSVLPLAFANPVSLFVYLGVFSGLSASSGSGTMRDLLLVPGVLAGAMLWWITLSGVISRFRKMIKLRTLLWINQIAGSIIMVFGLVLLFLPFININQ